jgi:hypothetical protein
MFQARHDNMDALVSAQLGRDGYALGKAYVDVASVILAGAAGAVADAADTALAIKDGEFSQDKSITDLTMAMASRKISGAAKAAEELVAMKVQ